MHLTDTDLLRTEIAAAAARMIAEDGADYATAKRKAARQVLGDSKPRGDILPDNAQIEDEVRAYQALFFGDIQPARLLHLRQLALEVMQQLARFNPYLTGSVLNGSAGAHSDIYLQLFTSSAKDVEIYLLNKNVNFEVSESRHFKGAGHHAPVETLSFLLPHKGGAPEGVHLAIYDEDDLRGGMKTSAGKRAERADIDTLRRLIEEQNQ
jgi:hypothetical protein